MDEPGHGEPSEDVYEDEGPTTVEEVSSGEPGEKTGEDGEVPGERGCAVEPAKCEDDE